MPGLAPVLSLPGDRMFQATEIMAAAMLGTAAKPPMWASIGLRPVAGTTIDFRVLPPFLSEREKLLLLSCWQQWDPTEVPSSALSQ